MADGAGGPLLNARGEVVGVATAGGSRGGGAGLAAPIDRVKPMLRDLPARRTTSLAVSPPSDR
ncbi:MAG TPA: hypothetical protein VGX21_07175 [Methylomirabilota bacterium]|nr:hypothetical protein [Methylomirabilota bacterium]